MDAIDLKIFVEHLFVIITVQCYQRMQLIVDKTTAGRKKDTEFWGEAITHRREQVFLLHVDIEIRIVSAVFAYSVSDV